MLATSIRTRSQARQQQLQQQQQEQQPVTAEQQRISDLSQRLKQHSEDMARLDHELDRANEACLSAEAKAQELTAWLESAEHSQAEAQQQVQTCQERCSHFEAESKHHPHNRSCRIAGL